MVRNVHRNHKAYLGRGEGGERVWRWGEREVIYLSLHCHHQHDTCIKMGSDESHFNVSVGSDGQSHKTVSTNHNLFEEKGQPKRYRAEVLPLTNQTGSQVYWQRCWVVIWLVPCETAAASARSVYTMHHVDSDFFFFFFSPAGTRTATFRSRVRHSNHTATRAPQADLA